MSPLQPAESMLPLVVTPQVEGAEQPDEAREPANYLWRPVLETGRRCHYQAVQEGLNRIAQAGHTNQRDEEDIDGPPPRLMRSGLTG